MKKAQNKNLHEVIYKFNLVKCIYSISQMTEWINKHEKDKINLNLKKRKKKRTTPVYILPAYMCKTTA